MRLLADENFPKPAVGALRAYGHDVLWARTDCIRWKDAAILDLAESEALIMLTLDKDFWQISVPRRTPLEESGVVLFRVHPTTPANLDPLVRTVYRGAKGMGRPCQHHRRRWNSDAECAKKVNRDRTLL